MYHTQQGRIALLTSTIFITKKNEKTYRYTTSRNFYSFLAHVHRFYKNTYSRYTIHTRVHARILIMPVNTLETTLSSW